MSERFKNEDKIKALYQNSEALLLLRARFWLDLGCRLPGLLVPARLISHAPCRPLSLRRRPQPVCALRLSLLRRPCMSVTPRGQRDDPLIICPIAIAYSMGQIIKSFCVCACVCVSICGHSHDRISSSIFTKLDTDV